MDRYVVHRDVAVSGSRRYLRPPLVGSTMTCKCAIKMSGPLYIYIYIYIYIYHIEVSCMYMYICSIYIYRYLIYIYICI